jgi:hypothetical protein
MENRNAYRIWWERQKERDQQEDLDMNLNGIGSGGMDRIHLAQDRDQWRALVNAVMNHRLP